jgi:hypothetical protein
MGQILWHNLKFANWFKTGMVLEGQIPAQTPTQSTSSLIQRVKPTAFPSAAVISAAQFLGYRQ